MCAAPAHLTQWKPGQSGNPGGLPKIPEALRKILALSQGEVTRLISKYARMNRDDILAAMKAKSTPMLELAIANIFAQSAERGDYARLAFLLDRAIGKVPVADPNDEEKEAFKEIRSLSDQELLRIVKEKVPGFDNGAS